MSYELGRVPISQLLTQNAVIAAIVEAISLAELCTGTGAECNVIPAPKRGHDEYLSRFDGNSWTKRPHVNTP